MLLRLGAGGVGLVRRSRVSVALEGSASVVSMGNLDGAAEQLAASARADGRFSLGASDPVSSPGGRGLRAGQ